MNWSDERYVKLYTRNTATWVLWPWQARAIFPHLLRATNYAGILETGGNDPLTALSVLIMMPREVVEVGIAAMIETGTVEAIRAGYLMPKYIEAQEATKTERVKKRDQRERQRAQARESIEAPVPSCPDLSLSVPLQPSTAQPSTAQPSTAQPTTSPPPARKSIVDQKPVDLEPLKLEPVGETPPRPSPPTVVFEHWAKASGHTRAVFDTKRRSAVEQALKAGYSPDDLCRAVDGCLVTPHNIGQNDRGERYDGLALICRDSEQIDRFIRNAASPPRPGNAKVIGGQVDRGARDETGYRPDEGPLRAVEMPL